MLELAQQHIIIIIYYVNIRHYRARELTDLYLYYIYYYIYMRTYTAIFNIMYVC